MSKEAVAATERYVGSLHADDRTGHDVAHLERVRRLAETLAEREAVDPLVVTLSALLHDVEDAKLGRPSGLVERHLETFDISALQRRHVMTVVSETSFSKGCDPSSLESAIIQDADRLDAIGAIGIARTFQFAGSRGTALYGDASALAHFDEKLLKLADRMHTPRAKQIAAKRHAFLVSFHDRFKAEWTGEDI
ncbi:HD domain-containing protein [Exiguobacterium sp.]|uniref:HD domain-containing protein n=1 Tax=Exiguobacterium sp. TaxID=44751 RepID=UPI00263BBFEC|nr:HD domain-containing protein [Exiguobacterium sp.]MCC5893229.1 metal-dependent phosphohydrolase [Exiguobacterium sp.]